MDSGTFYDCSVRSALTSSLSRGVSRSNIDSVEPATPCRLAVAASPVRVTASHSPPVTEVPNRRDTSAASSMVHTQQRSEFPGSPLNNHQRHSSCGQGNDELYSMPSSTHFRRPFRQYKTGSIDSEDLSTSAPLSNQPQSTRRLTVKDSSSTPSVLRRSISSALGLITRGRRSQLLHTGSSSGSSPCAATGSPDHGYVTLERSPPPPSTTNAVGAMTVDVLRQESETAARSFSPSGSSNDGALSCLDDVNEWSGQRAGQCGVPAAKRSSVDESTIYEELNNEITRTPTIVSESRDANVRMRDDEHRESGSLTTTGTVLFTTADAKPALTTGRAPLEPSNEFPSSYFSKDRFQVSNCRGSPSSFKAQYESPTNEIVRREDSLRPESTSEQGSSSIHETPLDESRKPSDVKLNSRLKSTEARFRQNSVDSTSIRGEVHDTRNIAQNVDSIHREHSAGQSEDSPLRGELNSCVELRRQSPSACFDNVSGNLTSCNCSAQDNEDIDVVRLRRVLQERDDELRVLRSTVGNNELAMLRVIEDTRLAWEAELNRAKAEFERRLRDVVESARRTERELESEILSLASANEVLRKTVVASRTKGGSVQSEHAIRRNSGIASDVRATDRSKPTRTDDRTFASLSMVASIDNDTKSTADCIPPKKIHANPSSDSAVTNEVDTLIKSRPSNSLEVERLRQHLKSMIEELAFSRQEFADERKIWLEEKERVIAYQRKLQLNYVQAMKRNAALEADLRQLKEELVQFLMANLVGNCVFSEGHRRELTSQRKLPASIVQTAVNSDNPVNESNC